MSKFERFVNLIGMLILLFAANAAVRWVNTGELFPQPKPVLYQGSLGEPEDWKFLSEPRTPALDPTYLRLLEQQRKYEQIDFSKLDGSMPSPSPWVSYPQPASGSTR